jgi:DNA-nicking Smr family endonuclease
MDRPLSAEEKALWAKVIETVRPLRPQATQPVHPQAPSPAPPAASSPRPRSARPRAAPAPPQPGTTLDGSWDRRLSRGLVNPDMTIDLHGHDLAGAYGRLDDSLERGIAGDARLLLLITGKPPSDDRRPVPRGAIRAAVGDWLGASRHAGNIAAVRGAHPRHGGAGALYIVLRRRR